MPSKHWKKEEAGRYTLELKHVGVTALVYREDDGYWYTKVSVGGRLPIPKYTMRMAKQAAEMVIREALQADLAALEEK